MIFLLLQYQFLFSLKLHSIKQSTIFYKIDMMKTQSFYLFKNTNQKSFEFPDKTEKLNKN